MQFGGLVNKVNVEHELHHFLQQKFGFTEFKAGQEEVITSLLNNRSTVAILPTGTGKSLCYQFFGEYTKQPVVIISPLLSLMQDQVEQLRLQGEKRVVALNSNLSFQDKRQVLEQLNRYAFIYLAPEMLRNEAVLAALLQLNIGLLVIDEAHCISAWGPDFRPDYLQLGQMRHQLGDPLTLAVTATATKRVLADMTKLLRLPASFKLVQYSVDRPNIFLATEKLPDEQTKKERLLSLLKQLPGPGLIYFSSKKQCDELTELIQQKTSLHVAAYHAGLSFAERYAVQQQFLTGQLDLICATSAFGMGINKTDIRYVIHYHMPQDLENYVQEIGRAGRDGQQSIAIILFNENDRFLQKRLAFNSLPNSDELELYQQSPAALKSASLESESAYLVTRYQQMGISFADMEQIFTQRRTEKLRALQQMLAYVNYPDCKRNFILRYFDEERVVKHQQNCCQLGEESYDLQQIFANVDQVTNNLPKNTPPSRDYRQVLQKLFRDD
ncbi:RecQ family ATP-dependent DNA helicase [Ligilactobacillus pabuli]|uniref:RecQ family ATP-dependent DNA helicase n=1 Tax=Ligilactobacillus pabuli TaxID=2886039 RepID=UPI001F93FCC7|nr:ATP-dependent DNA helicase RecQ [Ligilactobacillus pabuli]HIW88366.1 ATP-dependent DNA helicase [Candidatus Ligilactobacillus excrementipullorum]